MGAWGCESSSNDSTMDALVQYCKQINKPKQAEADKCLEKEFNTEYSSQSLGLVVWFLTHRLSVKEDFLRRCLEVIDKEHASNVHGWKNFKKRQDILLMEKEIIESALINQGKTLKTFEKEVGDILGMGLGAIHNDKLVPISEAISDDPSEED